MHRPAAAPSPATRPATPQAVTRPVTAARSAAADRGPRGHRVRDLAIGAAAALVLTASGFAAFRLVSRGAAAQTARAEPVTQRRELPLLEDGDMRLRVWVPAPMRPRAGGHRVFFELRNKLGELLRSETVVVTVQDPSGKATGLIARPRQADPDQFGFLYHYRIGGTYHVRIFPPETASAFDVPIEVAP